MGGPIIQIHLAIQYIIGRAANDIECASSSRHDGVNGGAIKPGSDQAAWHEVPGYELALLY